jgi:hypothetical protein
VIGHHGVRTDELSPLAATANRELLVAAPVLSPSAESQASVQRGSHRQYEHPTKPGKVTVAGKPNADVPRGTAANILRQAGLRRPSR